MGGLWIRALGPLEVVVEGAPAVVGAGKPRVVLECLALRANSVVTTDVLVEALWADRPPAKPAGQLQVYVANLRRLLEPHRPKTVSSKRLVSRSGGYTFTATEEELDLLRFRELVASGEVAVQGGDLVGGADALRQAVEMFEGRPFPDLADLEMFQPELDELEETRLNVHQDLVEVELALGRHGSLIGELQSVLVQQPYRERLWASLVIALYRCDRQVDALAACRNARRLFVEELGIDPGPRLQQVEQLVLQHDASLAAPAMDGHRRIRERLDNLPAGLTPLVGRDADLSALCSLLVAEVCRLVTVTGAGGTGKTRLALAVARQLIRRFPDGACWVDLAPLRHAQQVPSAIAGALGLEDWAGVEPLTAVTRFLRSRRALVVLDNFEHLEDGWPVVLDMLTAAPDLRLLTTSRRPLGLRAEYEYPLAPLALPPLDPPLPPDLLMEVAAVKLFLSRGRMISPQLDLDSSNAPIITRLCRRLDGLPLAIELAAAQLRHRSEQVLLDDLEVSFGALPAAFRDLPDRQRTLTATIAWSYELLGEHERQLFSELGVFVADPTVEAVSRICPAASDAEEVTKDLLTGLARHSLLRLYPDPAGVSRLSMLQSIREFAWDAVTSSRQDEELRRRHAEFYLSVAETLSPRLEGPEQVEALAQLNAEASDLRGALIWAAKADRSTELALRLVGQLWHYWELTGDVTEPCQITLNLLAGAPPDAPPSLMAPALTGAATMCWMLGRNQEADQYHKQALQAHQGAGDDGGVAFTTMCLAVLAVERNERDTGQQLAEEALASPHASLQTRVGAVTVLGLSAFYAGDHARALDLYRLSVELVRPIGDRWMLGMVLSNLADSTERAGEYESAEILLREALTASLELGSQGHIAPTLETLGAVYLGQHRVEQAVQALAAADAYRADRGIPLSPPERRRIEEIIARARTEAGPVQFGLAWASGQALTLTQAVHQLLHIQSRTK
jgi:predicted ATPase/DNA-binding SARP family transcriptional activator